MIITKTPFRVSLFGGGTDYREWFQSNGGLVVGGTINKYLYITSRFLPPFFDYNTRLSYYETETVNSHTEIKHNAFRDTILEIYYDVRGLEIHHTSDLPGRIGLGSSSAFIVGLIQNLNKLQKLYDYDKKELAEKASFIEQELLKETVGYQDAVLAAYGGFNYIEFSENAKIKIQPCGVTNEALKELERHLLLIYTNIKRTASEIASTYVSNINQKHQQKKIYKLTSEGLFAIHTQNMEEIGHLLHESWMCKRELSDKVSNKEIDEIYQIALDNGAWGGKITGAGGGGCMLLMAPPEKHKNILKVLPGLQNIDFRFEFEGSRVIFNNEE